MKLLLILFMSLGLLADDHDDMYEEVMLIMSTVMTMIIFQLKEGMKHLKTL